MSRNRQMIGSTRQMKIPTPIIEPKTIHFQPNAKAKSAVTQLRTNIFYVHTPFKRAEKREKEIFLQKKFLFLSEKTPPAESFQRENKNFFAKKFLFSLF